eukprot:scaffold8960_cov154-Skeletonema_menzelii.AAC.2
MQYEVFVELLRRRYAKSPKTGNLISLEYIWTVVAQFVDMDNLRLVFVMLISHQDTYEAVEPLSMANNP